MSLHLGLGRRRGAVGVLLVLSLFSLAACDDSTGPDPAGDGEVAFDADEAGAFQARGPLELDQGRPDTDEWAVAADPDSVGGIVVMAFQSSASAAGEGMLFVLQLRPARSGEFAECGPDEACHGRLFLDWRTDFSGFGEWFEIESGRVDVEVLTDSRIRGTFAFTLRSDGGSGTTTLTIEDGVFDVPIDGLANGVLCGVPPSQGCLSGE